MCKNNLILEYFQCKMTNNSPMDKLGFKKEKVFKAILMELVQVIVSQKLIYILLWNIEEMRMERSLYLILLPNQNAYFMKKIYYWIMSLKINQFCLIYMMN